MTYQSCKQLLLAFMLCLCLGACSSRTEGIDAQPALIPMPQEVTYQEGLFFLEGQVPLSISGVEGDELEQLQQLALQKLNANDSQVYTVYIAEANGEGGVMASIRLILDQTHGEAEAYTLSVTEEGAELRAGSTQGLRYALQTLVQLDLGQGRLPLCRIKDKPRFAYRGLMLDVSRHYMPVDYIIGLLDRMASYKLNRFHWHIVDGGGWRMQVDSYPLLTQKAAYRTVEGWDEWWHNGDRRFVDEANKAQGYGGYYTKDEIRQVVAYAQRQGITIVPEIEMPGHSNEVAAAYPELFCKQEWARDVTDVCIGREETFQFFETILKETMELFPSEYIHIGGDEAAMNHWGDCPKCQERMKKEGLKDLHELQSYMIRRIERFLKDNGRKLIGWDEILMGGLAPEATVMSWRGESGGIQAAEQGHDVIMTPNCSLYLDYYQTYGDSQPRAIGGYVPLKTVYEYNPVPQALTKDKQHHVLGVQANLWTEYVGSGQHADYMFFPRAIALAEVAWTEPEHKSYDSFRRRVSIHTDRLRSAGVDAYPLIGINARVEVDTLQRKAILHLDAERYPVQIRYTLDGTEPIESSALYTEPIETTDSLIILARPFAPGLVNAEPLLEYRVDYHKAIGAKVSYKNAWNKRYPAGEARALVDGLRGTPTYLDGLWQGFTEPLDMVIDLGQVQPIRHVFARFMQEREQWVYMPQSVEVWCSQDGKNYVSLGRLHPKTSEMNPRPCFETFDFYTNTQARYIRLEAPIGRSAGHFIFTDEVVVH